MVGVWTDISERKKAEEDLKRRNDELERFNRTMTGREARMIELKQQVNELSRQLGKSSPYSLEFLESAKEKPAREK